MATLFRLALSCASKAILHPPVNLSLRISWRAPAHSASVRWAFFVLRVAIMSVEALSSLIALGIGFALAGALASGYQALAHRPAGFGLLSNGATARAVAAVPFLVFAAPFIIMRNTVRGRRIESRRVEFVMLATVLAGFWSMMSGTFFVMILQAVGLLQG